MFWKFAKVFSCLTLMAVVGCMDLHHPSICDDTGLLCPAGTICSSDGTRCLDDLCGNGINDGIEECDNGGETATCDADCTIVVCGDGMINTSASEDCDDGNESNTDGCIECKKATCGDNYVQEGVEQCDDGNYIDGDGCDSDCKFAGCKDGIHSGNETDVDCGGICGASCKVGLACSSNTDCLTGPCVFGQCMPGGLATGEAHTCALRESGVAVCWGWGKYGQLGYGNVNDIGDDEYPRSVGGVRVGANIVQLTAGYGHTCALLDTGSVRCWGAAGYGQLGYGNTSRIGDDELPKTTPNVNIGGSGTPIQIAAGGYHTCALLDSGDVRCWGRGGAGRLGHGNTNHIGDNEVPAKAANVDIGGKAIQITAGDAHTCALLDSNDVRCWGSNAYGQLGYGNTDNVGDNEVPSTLATVDVGGTVIQIAAGDVHTCALLEGGAVRCWGYGGSGRLGYGDTNTIGDNESPASAGDVDIGVGGTAIQIATGGAHTCVLLDTGAVRCWGYGEYGRLGYHNTSEIGDNESPASVGNVNIGGTAIQIATGQAHTCAMLDSGAVRCWGKGTHGRLGYKSISHIGDNEYPDSAGNVSYE